MEFPWIVSPRKRSILTAELLMQVISSQYSVDDKLPPERILAQKMNVSRSTLREAIAALQLMGIIEVRHSQGNFIKAMPDKTQCRQSLDNILEIEGNPINDVDIRIALEPGVVWIAVERATARELELLESIMQNMEIALRNGDSVKYAEADSAFHLCIAECCHNEKLADTVATLLHSRKSPLWHAMKQGLDKKSITLKRIDEHRKIFEAIRERNQEDASARMREHLESSLERFLIDVESTFVS